ncbi:aldo/keto reductase [Arthrobacter sp. AL08]|uniref:aldo/keto reductase n=1 Tax=unclassified Arthrobacter TaxID=235627 RepID=UPI00249BA55C|nr:MULTISPECIES: aldo/keto reductase [unclassified Arthrobacter]MDI3241519.1 aldo/keto reductase [Arthrobacter sp. AL05]MDI3277224.1 aldo/keto reductase [Arthrobacter sp. AL08]
MSSRDGSGAANRSGQELIYGCMGLGGSWSPEPYASADVDEAALAVDAALEVGITLFDHADIYRGGKSEAVFGEVLAQTPELRNRIRLQTKCGIRLNEQGLEAYYDLSRGGILTRVNESLSRLRTDYVDVLMLHRPDPLMDPAEVASAVGQLMAEGKVRAVAVSNMSGAQIEVLQDRLETPVIANQLEMSLRQRAWLESTVLVNHAEGADYSFPHGTVEHCGRHGIALQAYGSLARGLYTGAPATTPSPAEEATSHLVAGLATRKGVAGESIVLGWLMKHPAGIAPVIGTAKPERIRACADAAAVAAGMTRAEWYRLWVTARGSNIP